MSYKMRIVPFKWDGEREVMVPSPRFVAICRKQFTNDVDYLMETVKPRSMKSHNRYFAALEEAFDNLSEEHAQRFKTAEHLRAWALVHTGFCKEQDYTFETPEEAKLVALIVRSRSAYSVIVVSGNAVKIFDAESQAVYGPDAMAPERFKESSNAVLDLVATMARTTPAELNRNAGRHA